MTTAGPLLFGTTHSAAVAQMALTSAPSENLGGTTAHSALVQYDALLGMNPNGGYLRFNNAAKIYALDLAGQMSFEADTQFLSINLASVGSTGTALGTSMNLFGLANAAAAEVFSMFKFSGAGGTLAVRARQDGSTLTSLNAQAVQEFAGSPLTAPIAIHSVGHGQYTRVTLDWIVDDAKTTRTITVAFDGVVLWRQTIPYYTWGNGSASSKFFIGASATAGTPMSGGYIRNFILGNTNIDWSQTGAIGPICLWGDSTVGDPGIGSPRYDATVVYSMLRRLAQQGYYYDPSDVVVARYAGYLASASAGSSLASTQDAVLATNPARLIYIAGTNDANQTVFPSDFTASVQAQIDAAAALPSLKSMVIANVRSVAAYTTGANANFVSNRDTKANPILASIAPATTKPFQRVNNYRLLNKDAMGPNTYVGWMTGDLSSAAKDNLHPAAYGCMIEGEVYADILAAQAVGASVIGTPSLSSSGWETSISPDTTGNRSTLGPNGWVVNEL